MLIDYGFVVTAHRDLSEADAGFSAVGRLYDDRDALTSFDAVTLAKKASGEARFGRRHPQLGPLTDDQQAGWSLAAGLAAALYPSVGVDLSVDWLADLEILNVVAGAVQRALGRAGLTTVGDYLDGGSAALIAACTRDFEHPVEQLLGLSQPAIVLHMALDADDLGRLCRQSFRNRSTGPTHSDK